MKGQKGKTVEVDDEAMLRLELSSPPTPVVRKSGRAEPLHYDRWTILPDFESAVLMRYIFAGGLFIPGSFGV